MKSLRECKKGGRIGSSIKRITRTKRNKEVITNIGQGVKQILLEREMVTFLKIL
ncbi:hypothetical protein [Sulfurovum sp. TSL1]|uniref:hypothetical protein n=1 Tax=Sulfurovum sp. TSL1 TaxID=2826994 RepID=UPI001CC48DBD|nr:hypothetical protein [Sulfurovum sp. TSL1]